MEASGLWRDLGCSSWTPEGGFSPSTRPLGPEAQLQLLAQDSIPSPRGSPPTPTSLGSAAPAGSWLASPFQAERQSSAWLCSLSSRKPRPPRPPARTPPNQLESRKKHLPARP